MNSKDIVDKPLSEIVFFLVNHPQLAEWIRQNLSLEQQIRGQYKKLITQAYIAGDDVARREVQYSLFFLNNLFIANPGSAAALNQFNPFLLEIRAKIQETWLEYEYTKNFVLNICENAPITEKLVALCHSHRAAKHPLFDFFESQATQTQLDYFFKSDSALNILFFDLVAFMLPGSHPETRTEICKNLWDEAGNGDPNHTHVGLYQYLLKHRDISLPDDHFANMYSWQGFTGYNLFMLGATNRQHYYKSIGAMAMTELLDPPQYTKLVQGIKRLGINEKYALYYTEHIEIDVDHADGWLNKVITPLLHNYPDAEDEIMAGAILRLQTCADYYDCLLSTINK